MRTEPPVRRLTSSQLFHRGMALMALAIVCGIADHGRHCGLLLLAIIFTGVGLALISEAEKRDSRQ